MALSGSACLIKCSKTSKSWIDCGYKLLRWKPKNDHFDPNYDECPYGNRPRTQSGGKTLVYTLNYIKRIKSHNFIGNCIVMAFCIYCKLL